MWKNTTYNGCHKGDGHPLTKWEVEHVDLSIGKTNSQLKKEFPHALIKRIVTLILPFSFLFTKKEYTPLVKREKYQDTPGSSFIYQNAPESSYYPYIKKIRFIK